MDRYGDYDDDDRGSRQRNSSNKSTLMVLGIGAAILGVCLLACGGLVYLAAKVIGEGMAAISTNMQQAMQQAQQMQEMQEAETTAEAFLEDIAGGFVDAAYARTSKGFQARQTLAQVPRVRESEPRRYRSSTPIRWMNLKSRLNQPLLRERCPAQMAMSPSRLVLIKDGPMWKVDRFTIP